MIEHGITDEFFELRLQRDRFARERHARHQIALSSPRCRQWAGIRSR